MQAVEVRHRSVRQDAGHAIQHKKQPLALGLREVRREIDRITRLRQMRAVLGGGGYLLKPNLKLLLISSSAAILPPFSLLPTNKNSARNAAHTRASWTMRSPFTMRFACNAALLIGVARAQGAAGAIWSPPGGTAARTLCSGVTGPMSETS